MRPDKVLDAIARALQDSGRLPTEMSYLTREADVSGQDANIDLPLTEIQVVSNIRANRHNTDFVDWSTNASGEHIGKIFEAVFGMRVQIDIWTVPGGGYDPHALGHDARLCLYEYDAAQRGVSFLDEGGNPIEDIKYFVLGDGEPVPDFASDYTVRRWRMDAHVEFVEVVDTASEYVEEYPIKTADTPSASAGVAGTDVAIELKHNQ